MGQNGENSKLDWMYKGANSLVNREEYLLGKNVDKPLEQLNKEEKEKKLGIVPPKNHVEHECIPPSIRDFNKIVLAEQVDLSAKLQEDPLVAIKRQEEDARRQFLQNPVQLKKLQEALKAQEIKKKKKKHKKSKHSESESDLDEKLRLKLKNLSNYKGTDIQKKQKKNHTDHLDTILMHKFNELKEKLSQEDLDDILAGKISDSDEETQKRKKASSEDSDGEVQLKLVKKRSKVSSEEDRELKKNYRKDKWDAKASKQVKGRDIKYREKSEERKSRKYKTRHKDDDVKNKYRNKRDSSSSSDSGVQNKRKTKDSRQKEKSRVPENLKNESDDDLDKMILLKLRSLRDSQSAKDTEEQKEKTTEGSYSYYDSDEDKVVHKKKAFGLVRPDGTKIPLNKNPQNSKVESTKKVEPVKKPELKRPKKLTEAEKDERRRQMMKDASKRDTERSENLKRYRQEEKRQEVQKDFDKDFVHKQLARTANEASMESRLKSNLNNLQRSSQHMSSNFSRR